MENIYTEKDIRKDIKQSIKQYISKGQKIVTRFPPEPSGYLHIGHVKALCVNFGLARLYEGDVLTRIDDTNPDNESFEYENAILEDMKRIGFNPDKLSHSSDYFDIILKYATDLITKGFAYVDDTPPEQLKNERMDRIISKNRSLSINDNLKLWKDMINGEKTDAVIRLKINMDDKNGCMRDPTIYRYVETSHPHTKNTFKVYPTYDFACPIIDSIEGVTHVFRTNEYCDRDIQYKTIIKMLEMRCPELFLYGKVNFKDTLLSKRNIKKQISDGTVSGWDDPRLATIRGVLNNGVSIEGLISFITTMGFANTNIEMTWDKFWAINRKIIDKICPRIHCISIHNIKLTIQNYKDVDIDILKFSRNKDLGNRVLHRTKNILIDQNVFDELDNNEEITLMNWGNMVIDKENKTLKLKLDGNPKLTKHKVIWVPDVNNLITVTKRKYIIPLQTISYVDELCVSEPYVYNQNVGDYFEFMRVGYFKVSQKVDSEYMICIEVDQGKSK